MDAESGNLMEITVSEWKTVAICKNRNEIKAHQVCDLIHQGGSTKYKGVSK